jgi:hypothetical protein
LSNKSNVRTAERGLREARLRRRQALEKGNAVDELAALLARLFPDAIRMRPGTSR